MGGGEAGGEGAGLAAGDCCADGGVWTDAFVVSGVESLGRKSPTTAAAVVASAPKAAKKPRRDHQKERLE